MLVGIAFLMAACTQPTATAATPTPSSSPLATPTAPSPTPSTAAASPTPTPTPALKGVYALVIKDFLAKPTYTLCGYGPGIYLVTALGKMAARPVTTKAYPSGWIDSTHLVVDSSLYTTNSSFPVLSIVNVSTGALARIQASGSFVAVLPGTL